MHCGLPPTMQCVLCPVPIGAVHGGFCTTVQCALCHVLRAPCIVPAVRLGAAAPCARFLVLCVALMCAVLSRLCPVLPTMHGVPCCATPRDPQLLALLGVGVRGGGGGEIAVGAGVTAYLGQQCSKKAAKNMSQPWGGGGHMLLQGAGGSRRVPVVMRAPRRGLARAAAGSTVAALTLGASARRRQRCGTWRRWPKRSSERTCPRLPSLRRQHLPARPRCCGGGGACSSAMCPSCPARQHRLNHQ